MHSILGQTFVLIALTAACFGAVVGITAGYRQSLKGLRWTRYAAYTFAAAMLAANLTMVHALLVHDFSVKYVADVGSRSTPTWVTIVSLWSSLEGSILFWGLILGAYIAAFTYFLRNRYREYMPYALGTILAVATFFAFLIAAPANPFSTVSPIPTDGPGPNPLLQNNILMVVHPPMLYLGYVGMAIPFGIAVAALLRGELSAGWLKPLRRWTLLPWLFLSIGIVFGSWWAYDVLGWGGYWAWDPVENASFLPWLAATAYLHATVVQERRRILKAWTLSLVLTAFLLTILGTFMTRSGVFNSVHSFTQSAIGPSFLVFLAICLVFSFGLLVGRAHLLESEGRIEAVVSRETAFLFNNAVFVIFTFTVLLGTVYPLIVEAVTGKKMSVGEPYFNTMALPIGIAMVFLMGVGPALPWGRPNFRAVFTRFIVPFAFAVLTAGLCVGFGLHQFETVLTFAVCAFAAVVTVEEMFGPAMQRVRNKGETFVAALGRSIATGRRRFGGYVVHLAIVVIVAGIAGSQTYRSNKAASLTVGDSMSLRGYKLTFMGSSSAQEPNRFRVFAKLKVTKNGRSLGIMSPGLNYYPTQREPVGTPYVASSGDEDLYLSLISVEPDGSRVGLKAYVIPLVAWIWWGLPVLVLGALISLWPRRRRRRATVPGGATAGAA